MPEIFLIRTVPIMNINEIVDTDGLMCGPSGDRGGDDDAIHENVGEIINLINNWEQDNNPQFGTWEAAAIVVTPYLFITCFIIVGITMTTVARWTRDIYDKLI